MWFVCLAFLVLQLDTSLAYNCPRPSGLFTDPERCTHYYECENSMPTSKVCGTGLFFNEKQKICDWPTSVDQSRCSGSGSSGGLNPNSNINSNSNSNSNANNGPDYSNIHHSNHIAFRCHADGLYEDPVSCEHFVQCQAGSPYRKICPAGLHFDIRISACNWPESMECSKHTRPVTTQRPPVGRPNTGRPNTGRPNTGQPNTGWPNTGRPNTGQPNTGWPNTGRPPVNRPPTNRPPFTTETPEPTGYPTPPYDPEREKESNMNFKPDRPPGRGNNPAPTGGSSSCEWCFKCPNREDTYHENSYDKYTYYHCFEGEPYLLYCPRNSIWIQRSKTCQSEKMNEAFDKDQDGGSDDGAGLIDARMKTRKPNVRPTTSKPKRNQRP